MKKTYKVLDTNIILLDANNIINLAGDSNTIVVLPSTTIDELDSKKGEIGEIGYQARQFGRLITSAEQQSTIKQEDLIITPFRLEDKQIHIVSTNTYPKYDDISPNIINDRKIIEIAIQYQNTFLDATVEFISNDVLARIRATAENITSKSLIEVEKTNYTFIKKIKLPQVVFSTIHNKLITDYDKDHKTENFNYVFECIDTGQVKLAIIVSNIIQVISKEAEAELGRQDLPPMNSEQKLLAKAISEPVIDFIIVEGKTGTSKTSTAISNALKVLKKTDTYDGLVYIRASLDDVPKEEEIGFLPGDEQQKNRHYFNPLYSVLESIVIRRNSNKNIKASEVEQFLEEHVSKLIDTNNIIMMTGLGMRGTTLNNKLIILDETQSQSKASLQKMLTRIGKNCKVIVIGSQNQIDNPYVTKHNNGLSVLLEAATKPNDINMYAIQLKKTVRSRLAEFVEDIFVASKNN
jgi:PhoH-like ATPase